MFYFGNIVLNGADYVVEQIEARRQTQALFATASFKYAGSLNFEVTGRNDWASTLAYTSHEGSGFFYYSAGASWVIGQKIELPRSISFA